MLTWQTMYNCCCRIFVVSAVTTILPTVPSVVVTGDSAPPPSSSSSQELSVTRLSTSIESISRFFRVVDSCLTMVEWKPLGVDTGMNVPLYNITNPTNAINCIRAE